LIFDGNGLHKFPTRKDIRIYQINATEYAYANNESKTINMIILGGLLKVRPIVEIQNVLSGLKKTLPARHHHLIPTNEKAIHTGMDLITEYVVK
jgi:2-oxoglutarate ferredoxin oxidoreductase subunit gamma